ncbi:MAG: ABC transporter permease [Ardenticatenaceae bacterium]|nr:ABC transporter permease [Ardenticatenaceae bacterium]
MAVARDTVGRGSVDERVVKRGVLGQLLGRPELGAVAGVIVLWTFFAVVAGDRGFLSLKGTASYLEVSAELGILAVAVALLMIAGEFDLSVGSLIGVSGMLMTILAVRLGWNIWAAIAVTFVVAVASGFFNGYLVIKTGLPSFLVTLATLFIYRGATIGVTRLITGRTQLGGLADAPGYHLAKAIFASDVTIAGVGFPISIVWWLALAGLATWLLLRTSFGNWIFASGGGAEAARNVGVPVNRVKVTLFIATALAASLVAIIQAVTFTGADVLRGQNQEFYAIIAVVIGGTLLSGGYGSAIGAVFGALIFGMVRQGIVFAGVDADWFQVFLGGMLLIAVLINTYVRSKAMEARR